MQENTVTVGLPEGLNAAMATQFVQIASKYRSRIMLIYEEKEVNAKSIMSLLTLAIPRGDALVLKVKGEDEVEANADLTHFIMTGEGSAYNLSSSPKS